MAKSAAAADKRKTSDEKVMAGSTDVTMAGAEILLKTLEDEGVNVIFGYPGGAVLPIYDALFKNNQIKHILVRMNKRRFTRLKAMLVQLAKGVALVTSAGGNKCGYWVTDALMDSVPVVCLTGQVPTHLIGNDAFQEADTTGITRACTKHNYLIKDASFCNKQLQRFHVARSGRPGPVLIDLPKDILMGEYTKSVGD